MNVITVLNRHANCLGLWLSLNLWLSLRLVTVFTPDKITQLPTGYAIAVVEVRWWLGLGSAGREYQQQGCKDQGFHSRVYPSSNSLVGDHET